MENPDDLIVPKGRARSLISQFENQTPSTKSAIAISEITSQINNIESLISTYTSYNRKMHVSLHGKVINILFLLNNETGKYSALKLKEFHGSIKKLLEYLDDKLPNYETFTPTSPKKSDNYDPFKYIRYSDHIKIKAKPKNEEIQMPSEEADVVDAPKQPEIKAYRTQTEKPVSVTALRSFFESLAKKNDLDNLAIQNYNPVMKSKSTNNLANFEPSVKKWPPAEFERSQSVSHLLDTETNNDKEEQFIPRFSPAVYRFEEKSDDLETNNVEENHTQSEESEEKNEEKFSDSGIEERIDEIDSKPSVYYSSQNIEPEDEEIIEETVSDNDFDEKEYEAILAQNQIEDNEEILDDILEETNSTQSEERDEEIEEKTYNYDHIKNNYVEDARNFDDSDKDSLDSDNLSQADSLDENNTPKNKCTTF